MNSSNLTQLLHVNIGDMGPACIDWCAQQHYTYSHSYLIIFFIALIVLFAVRITPLLVKDEEKANQYMWFLIDLHTLLLIGGFIAYKIIT